MYESQVCRICEAWLPNLASAEKHYDWHEKLNRRLEVIASQAARGEQAHNLMTPLG